MVRTPWLNKISRDVEFGAYCHGCKDSRDDSQKRPKSFKHDRRLFTAGLFDEHLKECGRIEGGEHHPDKDKHQDTTATVAQLYLAHMLARAACVTRTSATNLRNRLTLALR